MDSSFDRFMKFLMKRPLLVNLILIFIILSSVIAMFRMQRVALPRIDMYNVEVYTTYPGASPEDVELNVTRKIEEAIEGVGDIDEYTSHSMENLSIVSIKIRRSAEDKKEVLDEIRTEIGNITDFPDEVTEKPTIWDEKSDEWPMMNLGIYTSDDSDESFIEVAKALRDELITLSTVAGVDVSGSTDSEVRILLKKEKLKEYMISIEEIISAIQANKIRLSAGSIESFTSETNIVTLAEFNKPEDVRNIIIRINDTGNNILLEDIASIEKGYKKANTLNRINGKKGLSLQIVKQGNADILRAVKQINKAVDAFQNRYPINENITILPLRDESIETRNRLNILLSNAAVGLVLVLALLFFFFNRQLALWTAVGIPIAVGVAFIAVFFFDVTINRVSLVGLIVVLGMLVDDSIIVAENIYRYKEKGLGAMESALTGVKRVMAPVFATVITTVIAFVPMYFIPGMAMDFSREIPTFVIAMLVGSLVESVLILPLHLGHEKGHKGKGAKKKLKAPLGEGLLRSMENGYEALLKYALRFRYFSLIIILVSFAAMLGFSTLVVKFEMFPIDQSSSMYVWGETGQTASLHYTSENVKKIEKLLDSVPEKGLVKSYITTIGQKGMYNAQTLPNYFRIAITLHPSTDRTMSALDLKNYLIEEIKNSQITAFEKIDYYIDGGGPPAGKPVEAFIIGNDNEKRIELLNMVGKDFKELGMTEVDSDYRPGKPEMRLNPNNEIMSKAGLSISQIANVIRTAIDGTTVTEMQTADEEIPFRLQLEASSINKEDPLDGLFTINQMGIVIPVKNLLYITQSKTPQTIYRYNGKRTNKVTANLPEGKTPEEMTPILGNKYKDFEKKYPGFKIKLGGEAEENSETMAKMMIAIGLAILAVYFVLVIQFNSLIQPGMVISAIPFGLVGILLAFAVQRMNLSMLALVGIMGYSGVVVNDSLIMVDFINTLRNERLHKGSKSSFMQDVIDGAKLRFRPVFLTTITTVAGLIPTAYGFFGGLDSFISPMVMTMAWGLIVGTPSVLIIIPLYYSILEDIRKLVRKPEMVL